MTERERLLRKRRLKKKREDRRRRLSAETLANRAARLAKARAAQRKYSAANREKRNKAKN